MSGYPVCKWTCGECGDSYQADGVVGDFKVDRWMRDHKKAHRIEKMTAAELQAHYEREHEVTMACLGMRWGGEEA